MAVVVEIDGHRMILEARVLTVAIDCGCWQHSARPNRVIELAISPASGALLGMRALTTEPFTRSVRTGPLTLHISDLVSLEDNLRLETATKKKKEE